VRGGGGWKSEEEDGRVREEVENREHRMRNVYSVI
jgi:hypothetical protein